MIRTRLNSAEKHEAWELHDDLSGRTKSLCQMTTSVRSSQSNFSKRQDSTSKKELRIDGIRMYRCEVVVLKMSLVMSQDRWICTTHVANRDPSLSQQRRRGFTFPDGLKKDRQKRLSSSPVRRGQTASRSADTSRFETDSRGRTSASRQETPRTADNTSQPVLSSPKRDT